MIRKIVLGSAFVMALAGAAQAQSDLVKRGDYLVNTIMTCGNCHSPKGPQGDIPGKHFSGGLSWDEPPFKVTAPNITEDKETGIGAWTDDQIKHLLRTGERPNGVPIAAVMPVGFYKIITDGDLNAIVAYLRTIKPIKNKVPDPIYRFPAKSQTPPGAETAYTDAVMKEPAKHGFYLATIGHCFECHTPMGPKGHDWKAYGMGGMEFPGPWGKSVSRNITSSKIKGVGAWTDAQIKTAMTTGVDKDGQHLKPPMGFPYYAHMADGDLNDVIAYLRTVPAKD
jgi:mono/diheme cytochrome c family protein